MLLHVLMDLHSGHLAYVALRRADELEAERQRQWEEQRREWEADAAAALALREEAINANRSTHELRDPAHTGIEPDIGGDAITEERPA